MQERDTKMLLNIAFLYGRAQHDACQDQPPFFNSRFLRPSVYPNLRLHPKSLVCSMLKICWDPLAERANDSTLNNWWLFWVGERHIITGPMSKGFVAFLFGLVSLTGIGSVWAQGKV